MSTNCILKFFFLLEFLLNYIHTLEYNLNDFEKDDYSTITNKILNKGSMVTNLFI